MIMQYARQLPLIPSMSCMNLLAVAPVGSAMDNLDPHIKFAGTGPQQAPDAPVPFEIVETGVKEW